MPPADVPGAGPATTTTLSVGQTAPIRIHHLTESLCADARSLRRLLPNVAAEAVQRWESARRAGEPDPTAIAITLGRDPFLAANVGTIVDAGLFAPRDPGLDARDALVGLGIEVMRDVVLAAVTNELARRSTGFEAKTASLRRHALGCGLAARFLGRALGRPSSDDFVAGLLHDVGELILFQRCAEEGILLPGILEDPEDGPIIKDSLHYAHTAVGAALCRAWGLPETIARAAELHHDYMGPGKSDHLAHLSAAADVVMNHLTERSSMQPAEHPVLATLNLPPGSVERLVDELEAMLPAISAIS
jgi:HD-like signal output (HDOD) protein